MTKVLYRMLSEKISEIVKFIYSYAHLLTLPFISKLEDKHYTAWILSE